MAQPPPPSPAKARLLGFLGSLGGSRTLLGIHNDLKAGGPAHHTERFRRLTGRTPALWSGDFLFDHRAESRWDMVREAHRQWEAGAVVNLLWHAAPPDQGRTCAWEGGVLSRLTDAQWRDLVTDGGVLEREWRARMDEIAPYLEWLAERGVAVLFRPMHEMNKEKVWWGVRPGPDGGARLWRRTRDHFEKTRGLDNLAWTWDIQDLRFDWEGYHPGEGTFDVLAVDVYGKGYTDAVYREALRLAGGRPVAVGEAAVLPAPEELARQPRWAFAMGWSDLVFERNPPERLRALAEADRVLTLERMPGWGGGKPA